jgi:hypothetical protein
MDNGTAHFPTVSFIIEGTTRQVSNLVMSLESILNKNFCVDEQKCILGKHREVKTIKKS